MARGVTLAAVVQRAVELRTEQLTDLIETLAAKIREEIVDAWNKGQKKN